MNEFDFRSVFGDLGGRFDRTVSDDDDDDDDAKYRTIGELQLYHIHVCETDECSRTRFCRNQCVTEAEDRSACFKLREDYVECLHHRKEYKRENAIEAERQRKNEEHRVKVTEELLQEMWSFSWVKDEKYAPKPK